MVTARSVAAAVPDPELPIVTIADLGILRAVRIVGERVVVDITPTYSGCPALAEITADLRKGLRHNGFNDVEIRAVLSPAWTSDWITDTGRRKLAAAGIAPPGPAPKSPNGPVPLTLEPPTTRIACPHCAGTDTEEVSTFGPTACMALHRCRSCREPFEHMKAI
jgi:ring-1,2-phenylacetyl-CoA epoxidase subunit PaaD